MINVYNIQIGGLTFCSLVWDEQSTFKHKFWEDVGFSSHVAHESEWRKTVLQKEKATASQSVAIESPMGNVQDNV